MKRVFLTVLSLTVLVIQTMAQAPTFCPGIFNRGSYTQWGNGLDGTPNQQFFINVDVNNGLYFDAPLNPSSSRLDIQFNWRGGGTPGLFIKGSTKYIGLGTASPAGLLHLNAANPELYLTSTNATTPTGAIRGVNGSWLFGYSGAAGSEEIAMGTGDGTGSRTLGFYTGGSIKMKMLANGYLGIGTTAPQSILHVKSVSRQQMTMTSGGDTYAFSDIVFEPSSSTNTDPNLLNVWNQSHRKDGYFSGGSTNNGSTLEWYGSKIGGGYICPLAFKSNGDIILASNSNATSGNVVIGTTKVDAGYKLSVNGSIKAQGVKVTSLGWADYVFYNNYKLRPLSEVESFIKENKHLPEVPSAAEVEREGINLGETDALLLKKIEELTLYMIEMKKENEALRERIQKIENK